MGQRAVLPLGLQKGFLLVSTEFKKGLASPHSQLQRRRFEVTQPLPVTAPPPAVTYLPFYVALRSEGAC